MVYYEPLQSFTLLSLHFNTNTHHFIPFFLPSLFFLPPFLSLFSLSFFNEVYTLCVILKTDFSLNKRCCKMLSIYPSIHLCFEFREDGQNNNHHHLWIRAAVVPALAFGIYCKAREGGAAKTHKYEWAAALRRLCETVVGNFECGLSFVVRGLFSLSENTKHSTTVSPHHTIF